MKTLSSGQREVGDRKVHVKVVTSDETKDEEQQSVSERLVKENWGGCESAHQNRRSVAGGETDHGRVSGRRNTVCLYST